MTPPVGILDSGAILTVWRGRVKRARDGGNVRVHEFVQRGGLEVWDADLVDSNGTRIGGFRKLNGTRITRIKSQRDADRADQISTETRIARINP